MAEGDLAEALRRLMERGWRSGDPTRPDLAGLQDLMDRLVRRREELRERYQLGDVLGDIRRELEEIVAQERAGVEARLERAAAPTTATAARAPTGARRRAATARHAAATPDAGRRPRPARMLRDVAAKRLDQLDALPRRRRRAGSAACASTTSSNPAPATASTSSSSASASRSSTSSSPG